MQGEYSRNRHFEQGGENRFCFTMTEDSQFPVSPLYPYHFFISSPAEGTGMSLFAKDLVTNVLSVGGRVIVLDKGHSFKHACTLLEGKMNPSKMMNIFSCLMEKDAFIRGFFTLLLMKPWEVVFKMNRKWRKDGKID